VLAAEEQPGQVDVDHPVPGLGGRLLERDQAEPGNRDAGIGQHDVELAELIDRDADHRPDLVLDGDVATHGDGPPARIGHLLGHALGPLLIDVGDEHARPLLGEQQRALASQPSASAGDHDHLAVEPHRSPPSI
jgi:hypothetical protein